MELNTVVAVFLLVFSCSCLPLFARGNSIKAGKSITGNETLVSTGESFALGFFTPGNSTNSYLGIWYNTIPEQNVIWVANRESPIPQNSTVVFTIGIDGNFVIVDEKGKLIWSSNVTSTTGELETSNSTVGALLDNGNLVLKHGESNIWASFEHPTNTLMPRMKIRYNRKTGKQTVINSWTSKEDPRPGNFSFGVDPEGHDHYFIWNHSSIYYRFGREDEFPRRTLLGVTWHADYVSNRDEISLTFDQNKGPLIIRVVLDPSGHFLVQLTIQNNSNWVTTIREPQVECAVYAYCGPFGSCGILSGQCNCLPGFEPRFSEYSENEKWNEVCMRKVALECDGGDGFLKRENMKLPDHAISIGNMSSKDCETRCIRNCSCSAYAYSNSNCLIWFGDLLDLADNFNDSRALYVRVHGSLLSMFTSNLITLYEQRVKDRSN
ncbi:receptor-like serine/threonine-protein kinase SD1-8 [Lycium ferocissimum]|uniref:receptor-like serine/threonine-protein kinase SD1-8 n=1 Tax=Lycium ferocissimum TaxID=112874 RepID=UPI0028150F27|nr:receptor-like serine/threonine-protein kinase SD1-8 [Lycium ferocissimum]